MSLPWPDLTTAEWEVALRKVREHRERQAAPRSLYREDQLREGGKFADEGKGSTEPGYKRGSEAAAAPVLQGVDSKANAEREISRFRDQREYASWEHATDVVTNRANEKAAEDELRALPLVHGTTVAGAVGAAEDGLMSYADIQKNAAEFRERIADLNEELKEYGLDFAPSVLEGEGPMDIQSLIDDWAPEQGLSREDTRDMGEKLTELNDILKVLAGTTNQADKNLGLDQFVFMTHGQKHQDYGDVAVIISNSVLQDEGTFATENDIVMTPGALPDQTGKEFDASIPYTAEGVKRYQSTIVKGDDYYRVAAAKAGSPEKILHRSRHDLFEIKAPSVPKDAVRGFIVEDWDTATRLRDQLSGDKPVLHVTEHTRDSDRELNHQMKHVQDYGEWDLDSLREYNEKHDGAPMLPA